jgi:hypothetical protein
MTAALAGFGRENPKPGGAAIFFYIYIEIGAILGLFVCLSFKKFG